MYSVVLLMAMSQTPDTTAFFGKRHGCDGGCYGGCYGGGCLGGGGYGGGCLGGGMYMGAPPVAAPAPAPGPAPKPAGTMLSAPATIVVSLPADATLKVDGMATKATSDLRTFATPNLPYGQAFHYTLTAEIVRDGRSLTATQQVSVQGGVTSRVEIPANAFGQTVAAK